MNTQPPAPMNTAHTPDSKANQHAQHIDELRDLVKRYLRELEYAHGGHQQMPDMEGKFYEQATNALANAQKP